ncbi:hypothetical protein [Scale drop disease virus]|uniref:ORF_081R n=1 Tax=Scale drop disease virus TaxID=1697349 RepID=A0A0K1L693_9VIRU|nr:ORF_081R [Scale drop disease virus]AKU37496.1 ORF_081R [Scale drop disease virus]QLI60755.1 hypothetical protein [Scale drop disease virus]QXJ13673.1 ORF081R [Scale drop disease virus]UNH60700.1 hypothetical protein SDDV_ORF031 [Scale drop disease virus]
MYVEKLLEARGYEISDMKQLSGTEYHIPGQVYIVDCRSTRINATIINEYKEKMIEKAAILIYLQATHEALKKSQDPIRFDHTYDYNVIELFNAMYLMFDFSAQIPQITRNTTITEKRGLPKITTTDPSIKYYGFRKGDCVSVDDQWHKMIYFVD